VENNIKHGKSMFDKNFQVLLNNISDLYLLLEVRKDSNGNANNFVVVDVNNIFCRFFGVSKSEITGKELFDFVPYIDKKRFIELYNSSVTKGVIENKVSDIYFLDNEHNQYYYKAYSIDDENFVILISAVANKDSLNDKTSLIQNVYLEKIIDLTQEKVSSYINLLKIIADTAKKTVNGDWGGCYFYDSLAEEYKFIGIELLKEKNNKKLILQFNEVLKKGNTKLFSNSEIKKCFGDNQFESFVLIPAKLKGVIAVVFVIASGNIISNIHIKQLEFILNRSLFIVEKQKNQDQLLIEKIKAEASEARLIEIQKLGKIGWYEANLENNIFVGSSESFEIFFDEVSDVPITAEKLLSAVHPDDREYFISVIQKNIQKKSNSFEWEYRVISPKAGLKYVYSRAFLKFDNNGNLQRRFGIVQDITDKKKIELELIAHNERLESLFRMIHLTDVTSDKLYDIALHEAVKLSSAVMGIIFIHNKKTKNNNVISYSKNILNNSNILDIMSITNNKESEIFNTIVDNNRAVFYNNLSLVENKSSLFKAFNKKKKINNVIFVPVNISKTETIWLTILNYSKKYTSTDVKQMTLLMDNVWKVIERKKYQEELIKAKEKAEESDKLKSEFLANMSHEIRTPMNGIIGFSELLANNDVSDDKKNSYARIVIDSGKQLLNIIDDILDFSKIEAGQLEIKKSLVQVNDVITELFSIFSQTAQTNNLFLFPIKDLSDEDSVIVTDKNRLMQIFNNLLSNAFKFTNSGEISFGYKYDNDKLKFFVKDSGCGIDEELHDIIFDRFRRANNKHNKIIRGTGLGLAITKRLVELLDGEIWFESKENAGTTFYFTLPYKKADSSGIINKMGKVSKEFSVLIVEDDEINYLYLDELLSKLKLNLFHAKTGIEAIDICKKHADIDLVLMDIKLPEMDGIEATRKIREFRPNLTIIAQTAFAMDSDKEKVFLAGCSDFIAKPIKKEKLILLLKKYIKI
jgi:signal transduction histidine kinase/CheY-like chemotaxis protein/PAS domain-containing protein